MKASSGVCVSVYVCVRESREGGVRAMSGGPAEKDSKRMLTSHWENFSRSNAKRSRLIIRAVETPAAARGRIIILIDLLPSF